MFLCTVPVWPVPARPVCVWRWSEGICRRLQQDRPEEEQSATRSLLSWARRRTRREREREEKTAVNGNKKGEKKEKKEEGGGSYQVALISNYSNYFHSLP